MAKLQVLIDVQAELLKYGGKALAQNITTLCNRIWVTREIPEDWCVGIIIPIPKKGDLRDCNNWREITLLSVPGKVMCSIILDRIKGTVDKTLRQQQQVSTQVNHVQILEKMKEMNCTLLVNCKNFRKAFNSDTLSGTS